MESMILQAVIAGVFGGIASAVAAIATFRVEIKYLRRDVDQLMGAKKNGG